MAEFDRIIARAKARLATTSAPVVKRTSLNDTEIKRMAEYVYARALAWDERVRFGGRDEQMRIAAEMARVEGISERPLIPLEQWPQGGVPRKIYEENRAELLDTLRVMREAAAMATPLPFRTTYWKPCGPSTSSWTGNVRLTSG
ncbi:hypothetical protein ACVWZ4_001892 [Bradyrhizobium sp. USDA 4472]